MSVFLRLFRMLRANLAEAIGRAAPGDSGFADTDFSSHHHNSAAGPADRNVDPVLAGYYANLEIPYGSDLAAARRAWKKLVREYHPDLHSKDPEKVRIANELVQGLNHAYQEIEKHLKNQ